ncbi:uncharacterized protein LOC130764949 isoform X2 [Actinidia eriantha]|uniref:uncharacterized protein LOC130764949 isoform X2 n=1 Tax=Actinidia eriantha TaxID=165200 RepID=UPI00258E2901|nr:uncharacterized protein LOC130764949 isoform X2 [Actinidia eriantha]
MATVRNSSAARFTRFVLAALKSISSPSYSLSKSRPALSRAAEITSAAPAPAPNGSEYLFRRPRIADNAGDSKLSSSLNDAVVDGGFARQFLSSSRSYSTAANSQQINDPEFTEMAWERVGALDATQASKQQVVESEHLMKALWEQQQVFNEVFIGMQWEL